MWLGLLFGLIGCGDCADAGWRIWDDTDLQCCADLSRAPLAAPGELGEDDFEPSEYGFAADCVVEVGWFLGGSVCLPCGDGVCEAGLENHCNCVADCGDGGS